MSDESTNILLVTGGHPYEPEPFFALFDRLDGVSWQHAAHPEAQRFFNVREARRFDAIVCYDLPGIRFNPDQEPDYLEPDEIYKEHFLKLLDAGCGFVFLHHAIAGWPAWDQYAEIIGGRWQYRSGKVRREPMPDSGFRQDAKHTVRVLKHHPVTEGLPDEFELTDELYLYKIFDDAIEPLLASSYEFTQENFYSAAKAVGEQKITNEGWSHPDGSNVVGWTKTWGPSRIVYLQSGHDAVVYENPHYQRILTNAIRWVAGAG